MDCGLYYLLNELKKALLAASDHLCLEGCSPVLLNFLFNLDDPGFLLCLLKPFQDGVDGRNGRPDLEQVSVDEGLAHHELAPTIGSLRVERDGGRKSGAILIQMHKERLPCGEELVW